MVKKAILLVERGLLHSARPSKRLLRVSSLQKEHETQQQAIKSQNTLSPPNVFYKLEPCVIFELCLILLPQVSLRCHSHSAHSLPVSHKLVILHDSSKSQLPCFHTAPCTCTIDKCTLSSSLISPCQSSDTIPVTLLTFVVSVSSSNEHLW